MGVYYCAVNLTKREVLDPDDVGSIKRSGFAGAFPHVLAYAMLTRWRGDHVVIAADGSPDDEDPWNIARAFECVTEAVVADFNSEFGKIRQGGPIKLCRKSLAAKDG